MASLTSKLSDPALLSHHSCLDQKSAYLTKRWPDFTYPRPRTPQLGAKVETGRFDLSDFGKLRVWGSEWYELSLTVWSEETRSWMEIMKAVPCGPRTKGTSPGCQPNSL